jgi:two-component system, cell cycle sensor histidine kinase and response regulator CckA
MMNLPHLFLKSPFSESHGFGMVQRTLFLRLLRVFLAFGLPATVIGVLWSLDRALPALALVFGLFFILAALDMLLAEKLPFNVAAGILVFEVFVLSSILLYHVGLSGAGVPFAIVCCVLCMSFFNLRATVFLIIAYVVLFVLLAVGMVRGIIPVDAGYPDGSRSVIMWAGIIADFLMLTTILLFIQWALRGYIEHDLACATKGGLRIAEANRLLREENAGRRAVEEALRLSEERYRLIVENAHDAIFIGQDGMMKFPNRRALELLGYTREEAGATPFSLFIHPEDRARVMDNYARRLEGEAIPSPYTLRLVRKTGEAVWIDLSAVGFSWEGRPANLYFARDITAQKKLEAGSQRGQKLEAVGMLTGGIAHDFNNLLQVIQGYAELLMSDLPRDSRGRQGIIEIRQAAGRGSDLARQLLTFSRKMESALQPMDLNAAVRRVEQLLLRVLPRMIRIELRLSPDVKPINADPGQIEQVMMNLAINARDAMPWGGVLMVETMNSSLDEESCRAYPDLRPGAHVRLRVTDTGEGISAEALPHIFEPFYTTKDVDKGTGLGLAMAYGIIRNHHGTVCCQSSPGAGACFTIHLPAIVSGPPALVAPDDAPPPGGTETILVVDDEDSIRTLEERILRGAGYNVLVAVDGERALETYRMSRGRIDLVVLDLSMPGMGGRRCLDELLRFHPGARVVVSSGCIPEGSDPGVPGARGCVRKPFEIRAMLECIRRVLDEAPAAAGERSVRARSVCEAEFS